jgi:hypothetical protein
MLQWFGEWSEMERGDFLPALQVHGFGSNGGAANGAPAIMETLCKEEGRPLSQFKCRINLFTEWVQAWSGDDKHNFLSRIFQRDTNRKLSAKWSAVPIFQTLQSMWYQ